jgi:hypothetical protein
LYALGLAATSGGTSPDIPKSIWLEWGKFGKFLGHTLHFLHHDFVIGQHHGANAGDLVASHSGHEISECRIQGRNAFREAEFVTEKPVYHGFSLTFVCFHVPYSFSIWVVNAAELLGFRRIDTLRANMATSSVVVWLRAERE